MRYEQSHRDLLDSVTKFVKSDINPYIDEWEKAGIWPAHDVLKKMGSLGFLGIRKPEKFGGLDLDATYALAFAEGLGHIDCAGVQTGILVQTDMATPSLATFGSDELREEFLVPAITGDAVACVGVSEVHAGSDVAAIKTTAVKDGDDYIINGSKMWITNATQADWMCVLANTSKDAKHNNKSQIIVPLNLPGVTISPRLDKIGMRSSDTAQVFFDNVRVPQRHLIGKEGMGFVQQMLQFQEERIGAFSNIVTFENLIKETIEYTRDRMIFGQSVLDFQIVHYRLAELQTEIELLRSLSFRIVEAINHDDDPFEINRLASMLKLKLGRLARELTDALLQYFGGQGYMWENKIARAYRDTRIFSIAGGADEVMLGIIAKSMGIFPGQKKR